MKLTWSREDDMQHDIYRPASLTQFAAGLDADGWPVAWNARVASPSFSGLKDGVDRNGVDGIASVLYGIPNMRVEYHPPDAGIPVGYWRSVGCSQNTFFTESFIDEMAAAGGKDPVELRRRLLDKAPRLLGVLNLAAEKAGWGKPLPAGRFRGVAVVNNLGGFNAQVAEVSVDEGQVSRASRRLRSGLRTGGESRGCGATDSGRDCVRVIRAQGRHHDRSRPCSTGQLR